jgi:hypothetical protein
VRVLRHMQHIRRRVILLACVLALGLTAGGAYAWSYIVTYGGTEGPISLGHLDYRATPNEFFREWNRVYRTLTSGESDRMSLFYNGECCAVTNSTDNPFVDNRDSSGAVRAGCQNVSSPHSIINNVTCQTTHP